MHHSQQLNHFLKETEVRAFRIAEIATSNREDALELVQETMMKLVQNYADKDHEEWPPLFYKILHSKIKDWYRKQSVRNRVMSWFGIDDEENNPIYSSPERAEFEPENQLQAGIFTEKLEIALKVLPMRQQQAFLLRSWEGLSVKQTAEVMACSEGSVKTHYSRALAQLRQHLEEFQT